MNLRIRLSLFASIALLLGASSSFAATTAFEKDPFHNQAYVGAQLGYQHENLSAVFIAHGRPNNSKIRYGSHGGAFGVDIGYGTDFSNHMYLGGELGVIYHAVNGSLGKKVKTGIPASTVGGTINSTSLFYADILPGYVFDQKTLVYARLGLQLAEYKEQRIHTSYISSVYRTNYRLGLGVRYAVTPNILVGGSYTYVIIPKFVIADAKDIGATEHVSGHSNIFMIDVTYNLFNN